MTSIGNETGKGLSFGSVSAMLCGNARRVAGSCEMINTSDQDVFLWTVPVINSELRDVFGATVREVPIMRAIPAGGSATFPLRLKLDGLTPPGEYAITLALGEEQKEFVVQVPESTRIKIEPSQLTLIGELKAKIAKTLVVTNLGNVGFTVGKLGAVILEEDGGVCRSVQSSLRSQGAKGYQSFLDALVAELATTRVDMLRVGVPDDTPEIPPGESQMITLEFHLPGDLTAGRSYFGQLAIENTGIDLQVRALGSKNGTPNELSQRIESTN